MINIKLVGAILHTPKEIVFVGTYQSKSDAIWELNEAAKKYLRANPGIWESDLYEDWFEFDACETINYLINDYDGVVKRYQNSNFADEESK